MNKPDSDLSSRKLARAEANFVVYLREVQVFYTFASFTSAPFAWH